MLLAIDFGISNTDIAVSDRNQISFYTLASQSSVISLNDIKKILTHKFSLKSKNPNIPDDKKLDFKIWLDPESNIIIKVSYNRMGHWEYILKKIIYN